MKDIFQELYNKVISLFNSGKEEIDPTKNIAVNRLKTVLMQDRAGFSERAVQMMKEELISTVSKYMEIDTENFELQIDATEEGNTVLNLAIPVVKAKTDEEIDQALRVQELKTQRKAQEIVKELELLIKERAQTLIDGKIDPTLIEEATKKVENSTAEEKAEAEEKEDSEEKTEEKEPEEKVSEPTEEKEKTEEKTEEDKEIKETENQEKAEENKENKEPAAEKNGNKTESKKEESRKAWNLSMFYLTWESAKHRIRRIICSLY